MDPCWRRHESCSLVGLDPCASSYSKRLFSVTGRETDIAAGTERVRIACRVSFSHDVAYRLAAPKSMRTTTKNRFARLESGSEPDADGTLPLNLKLGNCCKRASSLRSGRSA